MRTMTLWLLTLAALAGAPGAAGRATPGQTAPSSAAGPRTTALGASGKLDEALLEWPLLPSSDQPYRRIDGRHLHQYVEEQAAISRRYRDQGHPKFWGRIIGTSSDQESAEWLAGKFKALGMSDVRIQPFDLAPQWMPQTWSVIVTSDGRSKELDSAQPYYGAKALPVGG